MNTSGKPTFRLVLGAGGLVGIAYHAGVLRAMTELGVDPNDASLIVGTSAGSVMGSYLRVGTSIDDLWTLAIGTHPSFDDLGATPDERRKSMSLVPSFGSASDLSRRMVGSYWVLMRSFMPMPLPRVPSTMQRAFRAGLFSMSGARRQMENDLGAHWPERALAICAVDLGSGQRTVFSATSDVSATLSQAVLASCAVPGLYVPIRLGRRVFVDGGVHSSTNLDVALRHDSQPVVCIAPMDYTADDADGAVVTSADALARLARRLPHRQLLGELAKAARQGTRVVLIRPTPTEVRRHGINLMRASGGELVAEEAYETIRSTRAIDDLAAVLT
jgi:NTE family protein